MVQLGQGLHELDMAGLSVTVVGYGRWCARKAKQTLAGVGWH